MPHWNVTTGESGFRNDNVFLASRRQSVGMLAKRGVGVTIEDCLICIRSIGRDWFVVFAGPIAFRLCDGIGLLSCLGLIDSHPTSSVSELFYFVVEAGIKADLLSTLQFNGFQRKCELEILAIGGWLEIDHATEDPLWNSCEKPFGFAPFGDGPHKPKYFEPPRLKAVPDKEGELLSETNEIRFRKAACQFIRAMRPNVTGILLLVWDSSPLHNPTKGGF